MKQIPTMLTVCNLKVIVLPNGEVICFGKTIGQFDELKENISEPPEPKGD